MRYFFLLIAMAIVTQNVIAQTKLYLYQDKNLQKPAKKKNANYVLQVTKQSDGSYKTNLFDIHTKEEVSFPGHRIGEPTGDNFNFPLNYIDTQCRENTYQLVNAPQNNIDSIGYKAFTLKGKNKTINDLLMRNLRYPEFAIEHDIQGKVYVQFTITRNGEVKDFVVKKSIHPSIDKKAIRVLKMIEVENLPTLHGSPQDFCFTQSVVFLLQ